MPLWAPDPLLEQPRWRLLVPSAPAVLRLPQTLPGLVAWQFAKDITQGDGTAVSQWDDSSGNSNHATQGTGARRPTYRADAAATGFPAVQFTATGGAGTEDALSYGSAVLAATNNISSILLVGVVRPITASGNRQFLAHSNGTVATNTRASAGLRTTWAAGARRTDADALGTALGVTTPTANASILVTVEIDYANNTGRVWLGRTLDIEDTTLVASGAGSTSATNSLGAALGSRGDIASEFFDGYIFDAYTYIPTLSSGDRTALWDWLEDEWPFLAPAAAYVPAIESQYGGFY